MGESPLGCCGWCWARLSRPFRWRGSPNPDITAAGPSATHNPLEATAPLEGRLPPELSDALESNLRAVPDTSRRLSNNLRHRLDEKRSVQAAQRLRAPSSWDDEDDYDFMVDVYRRAGVSAGQREGDTNGAHIPGALSAAALVFGSDVADADVLEPRVVDVQLSDESQSQGDLQGDDAKEGEDSVLTASPGMMLLFGPPRGGHSSAAGAPTTHSPRPPVSLLPSSRSPKVASPASACPDDEKSRAGAGVMVVGGAAEETERRMREAAISLLEPEEELDVEDEEMTEGRVQ